MQPLSSAQLAPLPGGSARRVFVFSGHVVDAPDRAIPRFPARLVPRAARALQELLTSLGAGPDDVALAQAANGGDILFLEACLERGVRCQVLLPHEEQYFLQHSVMRNNFNEAAWVERYQSIKKRLSTPVRDAPTYLGTLRPDEDAYERCNEWLLLTAKGLTGASSAIHFVCLWNGEEGGRGGTADMVRMANKAQVVMHWLDTRPWLSDGAASSGAAISALVVAALVLGVLAIVLARSHA